jgi:hypothetical protein
MIAEQLALYLHEKGYGIQNVDLFHGFQPNEPDNCIVVYDVSATVSSDSQALSVDEFGVQVLVRNTNYSTARDTIMTIHKSLVGFGGMPFITGGLTVHAVYIDTTPTSIGKDDKGRNEWSGHYRVRVESEGDLYRK